MNFSQDNVGPANRFLSDRQSSMRSASGSYGAGTSGPRQYGPNQQVIAYPPKPSRPQPVQQLVYWPGGYSRKSRTIAIVLGLMLAAWGGGYWYLGKVRKAVIFVCVNIVFFLLLLLWSWYLIVKLSDYEFFLYHQGTFFLGIMSLIVMPLIYQVLLLIDWYWNFVRNKTLVDSKGQLLL